MMIQSSILAIVATHRDGHHSSEPEVVIVWPDNALQVFLVLVVLGFLVIKYWHWARPCDTCGELKDQCRCKAPEYPHD